jgi:branched-chain amino acid transport system permease protein
MTAWHAPFLVALCAAVLLSTAVATVLAFPLAALRGPFQAIATLAFVLIVQSAALILSPITGGATGLNGIPKLVDYRAIGVFLLVCIYLVWRLDNSSVGRTLSAIAQDEVAAAVHGVSVGYYQLFVFGFSGMIAGGVGALRAAYSYTVVPEMFGFPAVVDVLSYVVIGGLGSLYGPVVGAILMTALPELARPFAEYRPIVVGVILIATICFMPHGLLGRRPAADGLKRWLPLWRKRSEQP